MDTSTAPACPACGFRVFNRRYPKCESCGAELPESIVYTPAERHTLQLADEEGQMARDRLERASDAAEVGAVSLDDVILDAAVRITPDL